MPDIYRGVFGFHIAKFQSEFSNSTLAQSIVEHQTGEHPPQISLGESCSAVTHNFIWFSACRGNLKHSVFVISLSTFPPAEQMCLYCKFVELAKSLRDGSQSVKVKAGAHGYHTIDHEDLQVLHEIDTLPPPTYTKWMGFTNAFSKPNGQ